MFFYLVEPIGFELPTIALFAVFEHFFSCCVCREVILQSFDGNVTVPFRTSAIFPFVCNRLIQAKVCLRLWKLVSLPYHTLS